MSRTYHCLSCKKQFYFYGKTAAAMDDLIIAQITIEKDGFFTGHIQPMAQDIQKKATCCDNPQILLRSIGD